MSNYTPGEWTVSKNMGEEPVVVSANHHDNGGFVICQTFGIHKHGNAVLIAAVPKLLAALRDAVEIIEGTGLDASLHRAAIAKATGEILEDKT